MIMKKKMLISFLIWIIVVNIGKIWPISKGERYYQNLQKWYLLASKEEWEKAKKIENKLKKEDIENYTKENEAGELRKKLNVIMTQKNKSADDWMEIAVLFYHLGDKDKALEAIKSAHELDPIREDINKIYFTLDSSPQIFQTP